MEEEIPSSQAGRLLPLSSMVHLADFIGIELSDDALLFLTKFKCKKDMAVFRMPKLEASVTKNVIERILGTPHVPFSYLVHDKSNEIINVEEELKEHLPESHNHLSSSSVKRPCFCSRPTPCKELEDDFESFEKRYFDFLLKIIGRNNNAELHILVKYLKYSEQVKIIADSSAFESFFQEIQPTFRSIDSVINITQCLVDNSHVDQSCDQFVESLVRVLKSIIFEIPLQTLNVDDYTTIFRKAASVLVKIISKWELLDTMRGLVVQDFGDQSQSSLNLRHHRGILIIFAHMQPRMLKHFFLPLLPKYLKLCRTLDKIMIVKNDHVDVISEILDVKQAFLHVCISLYRNVLHPAYRLDFSMAIECSQDYFGDSSVPWKCSYLQMKRTKMSAIVPNKLPQKIRRNFVPFERIPRSDLKKETAVIIDEEAQLDAEWNAINHSMEFDSSSESLNEAFELDQSPLLQHEEMTKSAFGSPTEFLGFEDEVFEFVKLKEKPVIKFNFIGSKQRFPLLPKKLDVDINECTSSCGRQFICGRLSKYLKHLVQAKGHQHSANLNIML